MHNKCFSACFKVSLLFDQMSKKLLILLDYPLSNLVLNIPAYRIHIYIFFLNRISKLAKGSNSTLTHSSN